MPRKTITIGGILTAIASIFFLLWALSVWSQVMQDPTNPEVIKSVTEDTAEKMVDEAIPTPMKIIIGIVTIFGGTLFAVILIIAVIKGWDYIMNYRIPINY
ncbi:MAG: hypothetical protein AABY32_02920 [Nanoarchaeota archaeon]